MAYKHKLYYILLYDIDIIMEVCRFLFTAPGDLRVCRAAQYYYARPPF